MAFDNAPPVGPPEEGYQLFGGAVPTIGLPGKSGADPELSRRGGPVRIWLASNNNFLSYQLQNESSWHQRLKFCVSSDFGVD